MKFVYWKKKLVRHFNIIITLILWHYIFQVPPKTQLNKNQNVPKIGLIFKLKYDLWPQSTTYWISSTINLRWNQVYLTFSSGRLYIHIKLMPSKCRFPAMTSNLQSGLITLGSMLKVYYLLQKYQELWYIMANLNEILNWATKTDRAILWQHGASSGFGQAKLIYTENSSWLVYLFAQIIFVWKSTHISDLFSNTWWRHQMEIFPHYWPFVRGIHQPPANELKTNDPTTCDVAITPHTYPLYAHNNNRGDTKFPGRCSVPWFIFVFGVLWEFAVMLQDL